MASIVKLTREVARLDARDCEIRLIDGDLFAVSRPFDELDLIALVEAVEIANAAWIGIPTRDERKLTRDNDDPQAWADVIIRNHDYPDADMLGHYIAD